MKKVFKPEFLNRVDDIVVFRSLTKEDLQSIIELEIKEVESRLKDQEVFIELTKSAKDFLIEKLEKESPFPVKGLLNVKA